MRSAASSTSCAQRRADETFWYFSGRSSNEAGFLLQLFARLYGTNNVNNCSYYCHQASGVGLASVTGSGTATIALEDLEHADLVFVIGGNPASNHPRLMRTLMHVRRRGGEVIVINPVVETGLVDFSVPSDVRSLLFGSEIASLYVQPHIGGDLALLTGVAKRIVEMGAHDEAFLDNHCEGWPELKSRLAETVVGRNHRQERRHARRDRRDRRAAMPRRRTSSSVGRWASRTMPTACKTCRRSPTSPCCAAWSAGPAAG